MLIGDILVREPSHVILQTDLSLKALDILLCYHYELHKTI